MADGDAPSAVHLRRAAAIAPCDIRNVDSTAETFLAVLNIQPATSTRRDTPAKAATVDYNTRIRDQPSEIDEHSATSVVHIPGEIAHKIHIGECDLQCNCVPENGHQHTPSARGCAAVFNSPALHRSRGIPGSHISELQSASSKK
jgi:hypothetical protein